MTVKPGPSNRSRRPGGAVTAASPAATAAGAMPSAQAVAAAPRRFSTWGAPTRHVQNGSGVPPNESTPRVPASVVSMSSGRTSAVSPAPTRTQRVRTSPASRAPAGPAMAARADHAGLEAGRAPDRLEDERGARLAVGAGDADEDEAGARIAGAAGGRRGQHATDAAHEGDGDLGVGRWSLGDDRPGAARHGLGQVAAAVGAEPGEGEEDLAGTDLARVRRDSCDVDVADGRVEAVDERAEPHQGAATASPGARRSASWRTERSGVPGSGSCAAT